MKLPSGEELRLLRPDLPRTTCGPKAGEEPWHCVIGIALQEEEGTEPNWGLKAS